MLLHRCSVAALLLAAALAVAGVPRVGWLDRVVDFHKQRFFNEVSELAPINIKAHIQQKPEGFKDSAQWDYDAVVRLLTLVRDSDTGKALRRMLRPTRRYKMSMKESMRWFPSIMKESDHLYYDVDYTSSEEDAIYNPMAAENQVVVITNPVESRMPSASISVDRLKRILEEKARVLRQMPPKRPPWLEATTAGSETTPPGSHATTPAPNGTTASGASDVPTTPAAGASNTTTPSGAGTSDDTTSETPTSMTN